jgi:hypothetical protein
LCRKNGTDAIGFADAELCADVRAVVCAEHHAEFRAGIDDDKKDFWNINCTISIQ